MRDIINIIDMIIETIKENDGYKETINELKEVKQDARYKAPEDRTICFEKAFQIIRRDFTPPESNVDYKVLSIWTCKSIEELKSEEEGK